jgi:hypothetical protein
MCQQCSTFWTFQWLEVCGSNVATFMARPKKSAWLRIRAQEDLWPRLQRVAERHSTTASNAAHTILIDGLERAEAAVLSENLNGQFVPDQGNFKHGF